MQPQRFEFKLFADYYQFYLQDELVDGNLGDAWTEPSLIAIAYAYEQATLHRRAPQKTPPLQ